MSKKKVLVWETLATVSGGQKMTLTVLDMLADQYDFCCLIPAEGMLSEELEKRNIEYVLMGDQTLPTGVKGKQVILRYGWMSLKNICKSLGVIRKYKPDLLYAPGPASLPWSAICGMLSHRPVIWHLHHIFLDGATKRFLNICGRFEAVKIIIVVSNCVGDQIFDEKAYTKVKVLYNPVDVEKYAGGCAENVLAEIENTLGRKIIQGGVILLTHIGAITKNKCQDFFVKVVAELKSMGKDVVGLMIGDAITETDKEYKLKIIGYIQENNLQTNIFMPGFRKDLPDILAVSDCLLIPSQEGLSLAAMEAMSAKCRIVSLDSYGAYELLKNAECGTFYPSKGLPVDAAEAVCRALCEQDEEVIDKGYSFCQSFSTKSYSRKIHEVFS